jgi:hypothetical protein
LLNRRRITDHAPTSFRSSFITSTNFARYRQGSADNDHAINTTENEQTAV